MAESPQSSKVTFIVLRYMRRPIMVLICVYALSMVGWIAIPGIDEDGNPENLSFFHAFYFLTYTVTTTGFGELPNTFTEAQRMWGIVSLYVGVIAWFYALGSIVGLVQNPDFQQSVMERRFAKQVAKITEPFFIICGFGNTGALLTRGLSDVGHTVVVIDKNSDRIKTVALRDYWSPVSGLCADARIPEHLIEAGLMKPNCRAVVALTQDEDVNLKISVTARLLNPSVWVVTQSTSEVHEDTLATLGENVHIIDPFQTYAKYLGATISNPAVHTLNQWLAGTKDADLSKTLKPPRGTWILCGFGRMGRWIRESLHRQGIETVVIEPHLDDKEEGSEEFVVGMANQKNLLAAGIQDAAGIVAGTNNDSDNLSILLNARALNPDLFSVVRQNRYRNQVVFQAANVDLIMMPGLVSARRIFFLLVAPMLKNFFEALREREAERDGAYIRSVVQRLESTVGGSQPRIWTVDTGDPAYRGLHRLIGQGKRVTLRHLIGDATDCTKTLACVPLMIHSGESIEVLPELSTAVKLGDEILFCGARRADYLVDATMYNEYTLTYLVTGRDAPRGWFFQWFSQKYGPETKSA